jgi:hypothetical protein
VPGERAVDVQEPVLFAPGIVAHLGKQFLRDVLAAALVDALLVHIVLRKNPELGKVAFANVRQTTGPFLDGAKCGAVQVAPIYKYVDQVRLPAQRQTGDAVVEDYEAGHRGLL